MNFFSGPKSRVWSGSILVSDQQNPDRLRARIHELESLCTDVLDAAAADLGLPEPLLNRLWAAVGHGDLPQGFKAGLPSTPGLVPARPEPMPIPGIPLTAKVVPLTDSATPPLPELKPLANRKTVCVVDDDPMMLDVLARTLQRENFELLMAAGGPEIIDRLQGYGGHVDLLVTDYAMPEMQGRELADRFRQKFPGVKVLYQTGFSDLLFRNRDELEEGEAFLEKPYTARGLREAARLVLFGSLNP